MEDKEFTEKLLKVVSVLAGSIAGFYWNLCDDNKGEDALGGLWLELEEVGGGCCGRAYIEPSMETLKGMSYMEVCAEISGAIDSAKLDYIKNRLGC